MGARIFIHPRCHEGPAVGALSAYLETQGFETERYGVGPCDSRGRRELVERCGPGKMGGVMLKRMDGTEYNHHAGWPAPLGD